MKPRIRVKYIDRRWYRLSDADNIELYCLSTYYNIYFNKYPDWLTYSQIGVSRGLNWFD